MTALAVAGTGFLLGWNVAWVPGPINAEILRRGARRGFGAAFVVGLGASCADFCWAAAVSFGAGAIAGSPGLRTGLAWVSMLLLAALAALFLRGAWRSAREAVAAPPGSGSHREPDKSPGTPLETRRGGWLFGFGMALVSPWNLAFWVGAVGQQAVRDAGAGASLLLAGGVVAGALCWCTVLSTASRFGARLPGPAWDAALRTVAAGFLLALGARTAVLL